MLSEAQRRSMQEMAASAEVREEFRRVRSLSQLPLDRPVDLDELVRFLTTMSRVSTVAPKPRPFVEYTRIKL